MTEPTKVESFPMAFREFVSIHSCVREVDSKLTEGFPPDTTPTLHFDSEGGATRARFKIYAYLKACDLSGNARLLAEAKAFRKFYVLTVKRGKTSSELLLVAKGQDELSQVFAQHNAQQSLKVGVDLQEGEEITINPEDL